MLSALLQVWRHFHPSRSDWAHAVRVTGRFDDPPGQPAVEDAVDDVLLAFYDDDDDVDADAEESARLTYTSSWDLERRTFHVDVFAHDRAVLDAALLALTGDDLLASCMLQARLRWSTSP